MGPIPTRSMRKLLKIKDPGVTFHVEQCIMGTYLYR